MKQLPVFVYGTLKPGRPAYTRLLAGHTLQELPASIAGAALFSDGSYPYLVTAAALCAADDRVHGYVITLAPAQYAERLAALDCYEGYRAASRWRLYDRIVLEARTEQRTLAIWAYVAGPQAMRNIEQGRLSKVPGGSWD